MTMQLAREIKKKEASKHQISKFKLRHDMTMWWEWRKCSPSLWAAWGGSWSHMTQDTLQDKVKGHMAWQDKGHMTWHKLNTSKKKSHQACELCEEVAEVIGWVEGEPGHAVAENQPGAQHQLGKILQRFSVRKLMLGLNLMWKKKI